MARLPVGVRCSKQLGIDFEHTSLVQGDEAVVHQADLASDDAMGKVPEVMASAGPDILDACGCG